MIDAIVPVDLARRPWNLLRRLRQQHWRAAANGLSLVIGHNDRGTVCDAILRRYCRREQIRMVSGTFYDGQVNNARLRNEAMRAVSAPMTLLLDADVLLERDTVAWMRATLDGHAADPASAPFCIVPCLYLSARGTRDLLRGRATQHGLLARYWTFERAPFLHLAVPSSIALFATEDFGRIGGFDERFSGHGYEDLDFLLRLALRHDLVPRTTALLCDRPTRAPLLSRGFRAWLARLALPALLTDKVAVHLWHTTVKDRYYQARSDNAAHFIEKLRGMVGDTGPKGTGDSEASYPDTSLIAFWAALCHTHRVAAERYSILFDDRPGQVDRVRSLRAMLATRLARFTI